MDLKKIIIVLVLIAVGGALLYGAKDKRPDEVGEKVDVKVATSTYDFGTIKMSKGVVSYDYELTNETGAPLEVSKVFTSCMCTQARVIVGGKEFGPYGMPGHGGATLAGITLAPKEKMTVRAQFDPAAHGPSGVGVAARSIYLDLNSTSTPRVELRFRANVVN